VRLYFDSSAMVKLAVNETESAALRSFIESLPDDELVTSAIARVEVVRAVLPGGANAVFRARSQLGLFTQLLLDGALLDRAATLLPDSRLRSLDAIHLATAQTLGGELRAVVTYDQRQAAAATDLGLPVTSPGA